MGFPLEGFNNDSAPQGNEGFVPEGNQGTGGGVHPAWNEMLGAIPQEYHEKVIPHLRTWDQNVQQVHQRYSPYAKIAGNTTPERLQQVMSVAQALEQNPRGFYDVLKQHLGIEEANAVMNELDEGEGEEAGPQNIPPQFQQQMQAFERQQEMMASMLLEQRQKEQQAQEDAELEALYGWMESQSEAFRTLNGIKQGGVGLAEPFVNDILARGGTPQQALQMLDMFVQNAGSFQAAPKAPAILSGQGGVVPQNARKVTDMSPKETRNLVVEALQASLRNK